MTTPSTVLEQPAPPANLSSEGVSFPNMDWFVRHFHEMAGEYPDHWLAIADNRIVAVADSPAALRQKLRQLGPGRHLVVHSHPEALANYK